jgi:2-methylcitrate dehydratase PrpD
VNGSLTHPLDYDDTKDEPPYHPTAATLPAALAIAERRGGVNGRELITAIALGNDLGVRLCSAPRGQLLSDYPWFAITVFGTFSATAAAGRLLGLSEEEMINALGIAIHRIFGITEVLTAPGSDIRAIRDGFTNEAGVICALMAHKKIKGCQDPIERLFKILYRGEYNPESLVSNLGTNFRGIEVSLKPWPACRETHGYIQAALEIVKENNIYPEQIAEVIFTVGNFGRDHLCEPIRIKRNPQLSIEAKFSLPFTVGIALAMRKVEISDFFPENLTSPKVLELGQKMTYQVNPAFGAIIPAQMALKTVDGRVFSKYIETIYGHPQNPLSKKDLIAKFKDCTRYAKKVLSPEKTECLIENIFNLENIADVRDILKIF